MTKVPRVVIHSRPRPPPGHGTKAIPGLGVKSQPGPGRHVSCENCRARKMRCSRTENCTSCTIRVRTPSPFFVSEQGLGDVITRLVVQGEECVWKDAIPSRTRADLDAETAQLEIERLHSVIETLTERLNYAESQLGFATGHVVATLPASASASTTTFAEEKSSPAYQVLDPPEYQSAPPSATANHPSFSDLPIPVSQQAEETKISLSSSSSPRVSVYAEDVNVKLELGDPAPTYLYVGYHPQVSTQGITGSIVAPAIGGPEEEWARMASQMQLQNQLALQHQAQAAQLHGWHHQQQHAISHQRQW
ncbi:hypothetical protein T439DRAFT_366178 [Meredithblackwellia eburnea MCA 4105]